MALISLYFFRSAAITVYVLCGLFTSNYVLSVGLLLHLVFQSLAYSQWMFQIVIVVILLSLDFWNTRNVCGRTLVGLRYWSRVDDDGESSWVFESRDVREVCIAIAKDHSDGRSTLR